MNPIILTLFPFPILSAVNINSYFVQVPYQILYFTCNDFLQMHLFPKLVYFVYPSSLPSFKYRINVWTYKGVLGSEDSQLKLHEKKIWLYDIPLYFAAMQQPLPWLTSAMIYLVQFSYSSDSPIYDWMTFVAVFFVFWFISLVNFRSLH